MKDIYGEKWANVGVEQWHLPFKLVFLLLRANNRLGGRGVQGGIQGHFFGISIPED